MSDDTGEFEKAAKAAKALSQRPDDHTLLQLYALFKQALEGDVQGGRPGYFDFVGAAKYAAREKLRGTGAEDARRQYIGLVRKLGGQF